MEAEDETGDLSRRRLSRALFTVSGGTKAVFFSTELCLGRQPPNAGEEELDAACAFFRYCSFMRSTIDFVFFGAAAASLLKKLVDDATTFTGERTGEGSLRCGDTVVETCGRGDEAEAEAETPVVLHDRLGVFGGSRLAEARLYVRRGTTGGGEGIFTI